MWGKSAIGREKEEKKPKYAVNGKILMVPTNDILPNPDQPRREYSYQKLLELSQSIVENGLLHPVTITFREGKPMLVAGERRLRAAKIAGMQEIPCIERETDDRQRALLALVENLQREEMNCFEEAEGYRRLIESYGLTQEEAAYRLGCAQSTVANKLRLLRLPPAERRRMIDAGLTERHARALLRLEEDDIRAAALDRVTAEKLNCAQTDRLVADLLAGRVKRKKATPLVRDVRLFFNTLSHAVDTMRRSGIRACAEKSETDEYIEYVVRIPKAEAVPSRGRKAKSDAARQTA